MVGGWGATSLGPLPRLSGWSARGEIMSDSEYAARRDSPQDQVRSRLGAHLLPGGQETRFRVWSTRAEQVAVRVNGERHQMEALPGGYFELVLPVGAGSRSSTSGVAKASHLTDWGCRSIASPCWTTDQSVDGPGPWLGVRMYASAP